MAVSDLAVLLRDMAPALHPEEYGFAALAPGEAAPVAAFAVIAEDEGPTLVAPAALLAGAGVAHEAGYARITLTVNSALSAVGLTAAVAQALAAEGIAANVIAASRHDHVFVPWDRREAAMAALRALSRGAG